MRRWRCGEEGFVLALVVLMLFAISVAGAAGYLVVSTEHRMARYASQGEEALSIARGGLHRFVAEQLGAVDDTAVYAMGQGEATVTARRISELDDRNHVYFIRSEGRIVDPGTPGAPARRVVGAYAIHRKRPVPLYAAVVVNAQGFDVHGTTVRGWDTGGSVCPGGSAPPIGGVVARAGVDEENGGVVDGSPDTALWPGGYAELVSRMGLRWDVLAHPSFPVDFEDAPPNFGSLPADSFPVIRYNGSLNASGSWSGRGVLIVTEQFGASSSFTWEGIVLAGWVDQSIEGSIDGMLVGGFADVDPYPEVETRGPIGYHSCNVERANESLSYLELVEKTVFEVG